MTMKRETTMTKTKRTIMKRVLAFALCFILTLAAFSLACNPALADGTVTLWGDANEDGTVDYGDYVSIEQHMLGQYSLTDTGMLTDTGRANADINRNHIVDIQDAVYIQKWLLKTISELGGNSAYTVSQADGIEFYLKIVSASGGVISDDGQRISFENAAEAKGAELVIQEFIKAPATLAVQSVGSTFSVSDKALSLQNGIRYDHEFDEEKDYTLNGENVTTKQFVCCFSRFINARAGIRSGQTLWGHSNAYKWTHTGPDQLSIIWVADEEDMAADFANGRSDAFPFAQFEAKIGNGITDGAYSVDVLDSLDRPDNDTQQSTYLLTADRNMYPITKHNSIMIQIGKEDDPLSVAYVNAKGEAQPEKTAIPVVSGETVWGETGKETWYAVTKDTTFADDARVTVKGDVNLILCDDQTLTVPYGITVEGNNSLTVWDQANGTGTLYAGTKDGEDYTAAKNCAGIGGEAGKACGTVIINGGQIYASSNDYQTGSDDFTGCGAGIGGGNYGAGGTVIINGGAVTAQAQHSTGIGSSQYSDSDACTAVIINGGTVLSKSYSGAGIGGTNGKVTITGGTVTAQSGFGAGIGGSDTCKGGEVTITGGRVNAMAASGAGIGCGRDYNGTQQGTLYVCLASGDDFVKASRYSGTVNVEDRQDSSRKVYLKDTKGNIYTGALSGDEISAIAGQKLTLAAPYTVTVADSDCATVSASPALAEAGAKIVVSISNVANGYELDTLSYKGKDDSAPTAITKTNNEYSFQMPAKDVTVTATFRYPCTLVYAPGVGGTGTMAGETVYLGETYTFPTCTFTALEHKTFSHWKMTGVDGMFYPDDPDKNTVKISSNCADDNGVITVTAYWKDIEPAKGEIKVQKNMNGRSFKPGDSFEFTIKAAEGVPMPAKTKITMNAAAGIECTESFGEITFTQTGTYTYTVSETHKGESINGVTYDATDKTIIIKVKDDGNGKLVADGTALTQTAEFTNEYGAGGKATLSVTKAVSGADWPTNASAVITLSAADGVPMPETASVTLTAAGQAIFGPITYDLADAGKTYVYTIRETSSTGFEDWFPGSEVITATVEVSEDIGDGKLNTVVTYNPAAATITNIAKEAAFVKTAPQAINPTWNGQTQTLVTAGEAEGGTMRYALGNDAATAPTTGYSASIPTGTEVGNYYVWYKAVGDDDHIDCGAACVTVSIGKKTVTVTARAQTILEGEAIETGVGYAELTDAVNSHYLSAITLTASGSEIVPSDAVILDMKGNDVTENYNISYAKGMLTVYAKISATVIFKAVNGGWNDETLTGDQTVTLTGYEGDSLKLTAAQIPGVGNKPADTYKAGAWDTAPSTETAFANGSTTTYTYTYAKKDRISATVVFKVVNGGWNDETLTGDQTVTLTGYEGDTLKLTAVQIPAVGNKPADTYKAGSWDTVPSIETAFANGSTTTYTYTYAAKDAISQTVTFKVVNGSWNDGNSADVTVTLTGLEGDTLKLAAAQIPAVGNKPADTYKAGVWDVTPSTETAITAPTTYTYTYAAKNPISATVTFKVVHGAWGDGTKEDKQVVLNGYEDEELRLEVDDIPDVTKPDEGYKYSTGVWTPKEPPINFDGAPTGDPITQDTTFTFTYGAMSKAAVTTSPAAKELTYNGSAQALVTAGTAENGAMAYALGADAATAPTDGWSESIPTGTDAGTYYVWYKAIGDEVHLDSDPAVVAAVIAAPGSSQTGEMQTLPGAPVPIDSNMADVVKSVVDAIQNGTLTGVPEEVKEALAKPGAKVTLTLISKPLTDSEVPAQDKAALDAAAKANGYDGYQPFDLSLLLTVTDPVTNETVSTYIHVSSKGVTFSLQVPEGLKKSGRTFYLLSCHDGKVDALSSTTGDVLAGESSLFSIYAIAYKDAAEPVSNSFYFKKVWEGSTEKSIDFTLYTADGKVNRQGFEKHILSEKEWSYSAVFQDAGSCYVIEKPIPGYITRYVNVGEYAGITDRCCNGGTIINKKIPKTGDETPILLWAGMLLIGAAGITAALIVSKRRKARK